MDVDNQLKGLSVLVTRPQHQANTLCMHLEHNGAVVVPFPTIDIQPTKIEQKEVLSLKPKIIVWMSPNAALNTPEWLVNSMQAQEGTHFIAIGLATQKVLNAMGFKETRTPPKGATSEKLLAWLADQFELKGIGIMLVKGQGGIDLLAKGLNAKKAKIFQLDVYRRTKAVVPDVLLKMKTWLDAPKPVSLFTSVEAFQNLLAIVPTMYHQRLLKHPMICASPRIKSHLQSKGATECILSSTTHDDDIVAALLELNTFA